MANKVRLRKDIDKLLDNPSDGVLFFPIDHTLSTLIILVNSNEGYFFELDIPEKYPHCQPAIRMLYGCVHPEACNEEGMLCLKYSKSGMWNLDDVLKSLRDLLVKGTKEVVPGEKMKAMQPDQEEQIRHAALYYAIRSGKTNFLNNIIQQWPGNVFVTNDRELDKVLSRAYAELKLKNVKIPQEMDICVQNKLLNIRLFSQSQKKSSNVQIVSIGIIERVEFVLENIKLLNSEYFDAKQIDDKFLFMATFIAQNIHTLKRQLRCTYDSLPWEEVEFCLISFVACYIKQQVINVFYRASLNKRKVLKMLDDFGRRLSDELKEINCFSIRKLTDLPCLKREAVVAKITRDCPEFADLYIDHQQIRDIHSLMVIRDYIELALSADPNKKEGQLIITRVLQVIGEYLKNTLESPKLSNSTSDLLLLALPKNTRKIIIDLRNSLSHAYALVKRTELEENNDATFFAGVQEDAKRISNVIIEILCKYKIKTIVMLISKIVCSEDHDEIREVAETFSCNDINAFTIMQERSEVTEHNRLQSLIKQLSELITEKTANEIKIFSEIDKLLDCEVTKVKKVKDNYLLGLSSLRNLGISLSNRELDVNTMRLIKNTASTVLDELSPTTDDTHCSEVIAFLTMQVTKSATNRSKVMDSCDTEMIGILSTEIYCLTMFGTGDLKWIEELKERVNVKGSFIPGPLRQLTSKSVEMYNDKLKVKLSELKRILEKHELDGSLSKSLPFYLGNKKLQATVEMLLLDILSILDVANLSPDTKQSFLYDYISILTGKHLRNHLAHGNVLVDILLVDPSIAVILNAQNLIVEMPKKRKQMLADSIKNDFTKLKEKYAKSLNTITEQAKLFDALEKGNLADIKYYLDKGGDINGIRRVDLSTSLHLAAAGNNLEVIKYVLGCNVAVDSKDRNGLSPIHIAATHGRSKIVNYFTKNLNVCVNEPDDDGNSPLHIAAKRGHAETVQVLLGNNADINKKDMYRFSPLHVAIANSQTEIAKILLGKEVNVDANESMGGFTPLILAAEKGCLELVQFLLKRSANVNARQHRGASPLHLASQNGHLEVVIALIHNGADVNSRVLDGCSSLQYATQYGHEEIVNLLIKHGADVNVIDETCQIRPLHYAARDGREKIVRTLLKNKANGNVATVDGMTPLHFAAENGHVKAVSILLKHGVSISPNNETNATPLHFAAANGHKEVVEILIENGVDSNVRNNFGETPLHLAAKRNDLHIIELLIKYKGDVNARDIIGYTPLHAAATNNCSVEIIEILMMNKAKVNVKALNGNTLLHAVAMNGDEDAITLLLKSGLEVNSRNCLGLNPLHAAVKEGHQKVVKLLLEHKCDVNAEGTAGTPLKTAVHSGHIEISKLLIENGAHINDDALFTAVERNDKDIVKFLLENGATFNGDLSEPLTLAVLAGYRDSVDLLLKYKAHINYDVRPDGVTLLHVAASRGHREILNILISGGANINAFTHDRVTPLHIATQEGHIDIVDILITKKAKINIVSKQNGTPLHIAAAIGHTSIVEVLLANGAKTNVKDHMNRTPLQMAVLNGRLSVVKMFLQFERVDINEDEDGTLLHIASQRNNLEMVKLLVKEGADINCRNSFGAKPIHMAARDGWRDIVEYFITVCQLSVNESCAANRTLLHYAGMEEGLEVVTYLLSQGADINAKDKDGMTPVHIAAYCGHENVIKALLEHGAIYNSLDKRLIDPLGMANNSSTINLLNVIDKLFESVKQNVPANVEDCICKGVPVNGRNKAGGTALHYAAWKGYEEVTEILLKGKANPNAQDRKGFAPIHYASKFSHFNTMKILLSNGAVYNVLSQGNKTPLDFAVDKNVTNLFTLIDEAFKMVEKGDVQVLKNLAKIQDQSTLKAVMCAHNKNNKTLVVVAMLSNFPKVEQLKQMSQGNTSAQIDAALLLAHQGDYVKSLGTYKSVLEKRKDVLGPDNPGTMDVQTKMAKVLYKQGKYSEALKIFEEVLEKQKKMLGPDSNDVLQSRGNIALVLHRQEKNEMAYEIFQEVYHKQKIALGPSHSDTLETQFHMAMVLDRLGKYDEALKIYRDSFKLREKTMGPYDMMTVCSQNNVAHVLGNLGKHDEALSIYKEVLKKKEMLLGVNHSDTLRTMHSMATLLCRQGKHNEALSAFEKVLSLQDRNHPETFGTQCNMANILFQQGKWPRALKIYSEIINQGISLFGANDPQVLVISQKIEIIKKMVTLEGANPSDLFIYIQNRISNAANDGDCKTVEHLLKNGAEVNGTDPEGRTALHFAVSNKHIDVVNILIQNDANVCHATKKGNTPLHTAASKGHNGIINILLENISKDKLRDVINATTTSSGVTALHVAAKGGFLDVVKSLLKFGASYNKINKDGKIPVDLTKSGRIRYLLTLIGELFKDVSKGDETAIEKLAAVKLDEMMAISNSKNREGKSLLQVAIAKGHKNIAKKLLELIKRE